MTTIAAGLFLAVLIGSFLQRISGMGMGLVAAPVLSLLMGPVEGVLVVNLLAMVNAALTTATVHRDIDWAKFGSIAPYLVVGAVPGALLIRAVSSDVLLVVVGALLLIALAVVTLGKQHVPVVEGRVAAGAAGAAGGFMNTLAGVAGPAITVYSQAARWDQRTYAATLQPIFVVSGAVSFVIKELAGAADVGGIAPQLWVVGAAAMLIGVFLGVRIAPRVPARRARGIALGLAVAGGATALVRGALGVLG